MAEKNIPMSFPTSSGTFHDPKDENWSKIGQKQQEIDKNRLKSQNMGMGPPC